MTRTFAAVMCSVALAASVTARAPIAAAQTTPQTQPPRTPPRDPNAVTASATGSGRIRGRVIDAGTSRPIRRAQVTLTSDQLATRMVTSDSDGQYEFLDLPSGRFTVSANKGGYLKLEYGQRRPFQTGTPVALTSGQQQEQIDLFLPRAGAISGRITDRFGDPVIGGEIRIERYQYSADGQRRLAPVAGGATTTDDLGQFRVFGLMPGEYVVRSNIRGRPPLSAQAASAPVAGYVQTYNPGTANAVDAQPVLLALGEEVSVQFPMVVGRIARISGRVTDSSGRPAARGELTLVTRSLNGFLSGRGSGSVAADGTFSIPNVPPGDHYVQVKLSARPDGPLVNEYANVPAATAGDNIADLQIHTLPGSTVTGVVEWDGTAPRAAGAATLPLKIMTTAADGRPPLSMMVGITDPGADGAVRTGTSFRLSTIVGRNRFTVDAVPPQWMVRSITVNGVDVMTNGIDATSLVPGSELRVVLTDKITEVNGTVRNAQKASVNEYVVVVLPADPVDQDLAPRYTRALRPDQRDAFRVQALPPGRYIVAAVGPLEEGAHWDPALQAAIRNAPTSQRFTLVEGQSATLTLELMP